MIQPQTDIEPAGINAKDHFCEIKVELPMEDSDKVQVVKCRVVALEQCADCATWICGNEEGGHCTICVRCGEKFCPEHYQAHRLANNCLERAA